MILLDPGNHQRKYPDDRSREVMLDTIEFFESKGKQKVLEDDQAAAWYQDFIDFSRDHGILATMC
ncbi:MAG: acyl-CoA dehydrogenase, partial [Acidimicrobiia bacterium]|nr:acyl-CoA dehydrogenase [Acidimicrobiia bacterium]